MLANSLIKKPQLIDKQIVEVLICIDGDRVRIFSISCIVFITR